MRVIRSKRADRNTLYASLIGDKRDAGLRRMTLNILYKSSILLFIIVQSAAILGPSLGSLQLNVSSAFQNAFWRETPEVRVVMRSTADWARIMFDDTNGTNTNGIRFKRVGDYGWVIRHDDDDIIHVGMDVTWFDVLYGGESVNKTGDIFAFFKGDNDFEYTEAYADIVFEVDTNVPQVYIYLMIAGKGVTSFEMYIKKTNTLIWKETHSGDGRTQHIKKYIASQIFFQAPRVGSITVISMALITVLIMVGLNLPRIKSRGKPEM